MSFKFTYNKPVLKFIDLKRCDVICSSEICNCDCTVTPDETFIDSCYYHTPENNYGNKFENTDVIS